MNAYQVLGVVKTASPAEVMKAWRKMSQKWHPDRNKAKGAEVQFKLVQEAYEFIVSGKSIAGSFKKPAPKPKPVPKTEFAPGAEPEYAQAYHDSFTVPKLVVTVTFNEMFNGGRYPVPQSNMVVKVPPGVYTGFIQRQKVFSPDLTQSMVFDIQYEVIDLNGFYSVQSIDRAGPQLYCEYKASIASILAEQEVTIRNANSMVGDITFNLKAESMIKIPHAGLPRGSSRDLLYVKILPIYADLSSTRDETLYALRAKIDKQLNRHRR